MQLTCNERNKRKRLNTFLFNCHFLSETCRYQKRQGICEICGHNNISGLSTKSTKHQCAWSDLCHSAYADNASTRVFVRALLRLLYRWCTQRTKPTLLLLLDVTVTHAAYFIGGNSLGRYIPPPPAHAATADIRESGG